MTGRPVRVLGLVAILGFCCATLRAVEAPGVPRQVRGLPHAALVPGKRVYLTWRAPADPGSGVSGYVVYRDGEILHKLPTRNFANGLAGAQAHYRHEDRDVNEGETHTYRIAAYHRVPGDDADDWPVGPATAPESVRVDMEASRLYFFLRTDWHGGTPRVRENFGTGGATTFTLRRATLRHRSDRALFYRTDGTLVSTTDAVRLGRAFDGDPSLGSVIRKRGIYHNDLNAFGAPPDADGRLRVYILIDEFSGSPTTLGYFWGINEKVDHPRLVGHRSELLYIRNRPDWEDAASTIAHEFQHCIHYRHDKWERPWVNEGCSTLAQDVCDYFNDVCRDRLEDYRDYYGGYRRSMRHLANRRDFEYQISFSKFLYARERTDDPSGGARGEFPDLTRFVADADNDTRGFPLAGVEYKDLFRDWAVAVHVNSDKFTDDQDKPIYDFAHGSPSSGDHINEDLRIEFRPRSGPRTVPYGETPATYSEPGHLHINNVRVRESSQRVLGFDLRDRNPGVLCVNLDGVNVPSAEDYVYLVCETGADGRDRLIRKQADGGRVRFRLANWAGYAPYGHFSRARCVTPAPFGRFQYDVEYYNRPLILTLHMPWRIQPDQDTIPVLVWYPIPETNPPLQVHALRVYEHGNDEEVADAWVRDPFGGAYPADLADAGADRFFRIGELRADRFSFMNDFDHDTALDAKIRLDLYVSDNAADMIGDRREGKTIAPPEPAVRREFVVNRGAPFPDALGWDYLDPYTHSHRSRQHAPRWDFGGPDDMADECDEAIGLDEHLATDYAADLGQAADGTARAREACKLVPLDAYGQGRYVAAYECRTPIYDTEATLRNDLQTAQTAADAGDAEAAERAEQIRMQYNSLEGMMRRVAQHGGAGWCVGRSGFPVEPEWPVEDYTDPVLYDAKRAGQEYALKGLLAWAGDTVRQGPCFLWWTDPFFGVEPPYPDANPPQPPVAPAAGGAAPAPAPAPSCPAWTPVDRYAQVEASLDTFDKLLQTTLANTRRAHPGSEYAGGTFVRKLYLAAGSNAYADFNYTLVEDTGETAKSEAGSGAYGRVRTYAQDGRDGMMRGRAMMTNGPLLHFDADSDGHFHSGDHQWDGRDNRRFREQVDGQIGGEGTFDGRYTLVINRARTEDGWFHWLWDSNDDYGLMYPTATGWMVTPDGRTEQAFMPTPRPGKKQEANPFALVKLSALRWRLRTHPQFEGGPEYRCYTNPMWVIPVTIDIFVDDVRLGEGGSMSIPAGKLRAHFTFDVSMLPEPCQVEAHTVDDQTWRGPGGSMTTLVPDGGKQGWYDDGPIKNCIYKAKSTVPLVENHFQPVLLERFYVFIDKLRDRNGNPLNAVAEQSIFGLNISADAWGYPICDHTIVPSTPEDDMAVPEAYADRTVTATYAFEGCGNPSGHMFDLVLCNHTDDAISVAVPGGMVIVNTADPPAEGPGYQNVVVGEPVTVEVPPGETVRTPIEGYCLDRTQEAPPDTRTRARRPEGTRPREPEAPPTYEKTCASPQYKVHRVITVVAKILGEEGKLKTPFTGEKAIDTVAQWAIWKETSESDEDPDNDLGPEDLREEMRGQVEESTGKPFEELPKPTQEKLDKDIDDLWESVDLCQKEAKKVAEGGQAQTEEPAPKPPAPGEGGA